MLLENILWLNRIEEKNMVRKGKQRKWQVYSIIGPKKNIIEKTTHQTSI